MSLGVRKAKPLRAARRALSADSDMGEPRDTLVLQDDHHRNCLCLELARKGALLVNCKMQSSKSDGHKQTRSTKLYGRMQQD